MIPNARRMVPGMLASLLIAAPVCATKAHAAAADRSHHTGAGKVAERGRTAAHQRAHHRYAARRRAAPHAAPVNSVAFFDDGAPIRHALIQHSFWQQSGMATWYGGPRWQGRRTASGARYEQDGLTGAHATLPLGSKVRVSLEGTGRSVIVTINDRPGTHRIVIDLSRGAARELGMLDRGIARVTLSSVQ